MFSKNLRNISYNKLLKLNRSIGTSKLLLSKQSESESTLKFTFTEENQRRLDAIFSLYPEAERRAALMPVLDLAQRQHGWLPQSALHTVAEMFKMNPIDIYDFVYFYDWFRLTPSGKFRIAVCNSTPCLLRGADKIFDICKKALCLEDKETSKDMQFSLRRCVCMGACVNAPSVCINDDYYEDVSELDMASIISDLKKDKIPPAGPRRDRFSCEPKKGLTTLKCDPPPPGYKMQKLKKVDKEDDC